MELITSLTNAKVKMAISLQQKKYRDKNKLFLLEGIRNAEMMIAKNVEISMCFVTAKAINNERAKLLLEKLTCPCYEVPEHIYQKISDTQTPQGLMLIIPRHTLELTDIAKREGLYLILDRLQDPGNIGTLIRTADAMGVKAIICLNGTADIYSPKVVRSAMGSLFNLPIITKLSEENLINYCQQQNLSLYATALDDTAKASWDIAYPKSCAVILGNEANGVSNNLLEKCKAKVYIPMLGDAESLNVANAGAMIMYEYCRQNI